MAKVVFEKEEAERIAIAYLPRKFPAVISQPAHDFVAFNAQAIESGTSSFRVDPLVARQTGIAELERLSIAEKVEREALARLKDFQELAYREAYQLGLDEGRERSFNEHSAQFLEKFQHLDELLQSIERLKADLIACNETQIVRMVYYMAKRLLYDEISARPEVVIEVVRQALMGAQSDENVTVRVSQSDFAFIDGMKEKLDKEFDDVKRLKFEGSDDVTSGGCVVETNFGDVNATLEQRLERLWTQLADKLPKTNDVMSAQPGDNETESGEGGGAPGEGES